MTTFNCNDTVAALSSCFVAMPRVVQSHRSMHNAQPVATRDAADASARHTVPTGRAEAPPRPAEAAPDRRSAGGSLAARSVLGPIASICCDDAFLNRDRIGCLPSHRRSVAMTVCAACRRLAADALEGKGKGQPMHGPASAAAAGDPVGGASREQSPLLDTLLPGYLSRPNPSPVKVRHWLLMRPELTLCNSRCDLHPVLKSACAV